MSTYYYIVNTQDKTYFNLGKGSWYILKDELEALYDQEYLELFLQEDIFDISYDNEMKEYLVGLAKTLFNLFGKTNKTNLKVISDSTDDLVCMKAKKYKCIGSRYSDDTNLNEHLQDTPLNNRWYNHDNYLKYPEWKEY